MRRSRVSHPRCQRHRFQIRQQPADCSATTGLAGAVQFPSLGPVPPITARLRHVPASHSATINCTDEDSRDKRIPSPGRWKRAAADWLVRHRLLQHRLVQDWGRTGACATSRSRRAGEWQRCGLCPTRGTRHSRQELPSYHPALPMWTFLLVDDISRNFPCPTGPNR